MTTKTAKPKPCRCYAKLEKILEKDYPHLKLTPVFVFGKRRTEARFRISTEKVRGSRKPNIAITPDFCPFCGVRLPGEEDDGRKVVGRRRKP